MPLTQKGIEKGSNNAMEYASQADHFAKAGRGGLSPLRNDPPGGALLWLARATDMHAQNLARNRPHGARPSYHVT